MKHSRQTATGLLRFFSFLSLLRNEVESCAPAGKKTCSIEAQARKDPGVSRSLCSLFLLSSFALKKITLFSVNALSTTVPIEDTINKQTNIEQKLDQLEADQLAIYKARRRPRNTNPSSNIGRDEDLSPWPSITSPAP